MKKLRWLVMLTAFVLVRAYSLHAQDVTWIRQFGTGLDGAAISIATHSTGVYLAGYTLGVFPTQAGSGGQDAYLRKYDANGNEVWTRQFGTAGLDRADALTVNDTGVYVAGRTSGSLPGQLSAGFSDAYVRKYDFNGNEVWTRQFGTDRGDAILALSVHYTDLYVWGNTLGTFPGQVTHGDRDFFVAKFDDDGNAVWIRQFGTAASDSATPGALAVNDTGLYVAGRAFAPLPGQLSAASVDAFVRKYDSDGNEVWTRQFGTACVTAAVGVAVHTTGVYVTGATNGDFNKPARCSPMAIFGQDTTGFLRRFDFDGNVVWTRQIRASGQGPQYENNTEVVTVNDGGVYIAGFGVGVLAGQTPGGPNSDHSVCPRTRFFDDADAYVRKYDFDGSVIWTRQFGSSRFDVVHGIAVDNDGVYATGFTNCILPGQTSAGGPDAFVIKLTATPATVEGMIQLIVGRVDTLLDEGTLNRGQGHSLQATARAAADRSDQGQNAQAIREMQTFISKVVGFRNSGILSSAQAQALIDSANAVISQL